MTLVDAHLCWYASILYSVTVFLFGDMYSITLGFIMNLNSDIFSFQIAFPAWN